MRKIKVDKIEWNIRKIEQLIAILKNYGKTHAERRKFEEHNKNIEYLIQRQKFLCFVLAFQLLTTEIF